MKISKKVLGVAMSIAVLGSQAMTVLATDVTPTTPTTTGGNANILDYKVETVVVPTALKVALNPKGYAVTTGYVKADSYAANTVYYTESGGTYTKANPQPDSTAFGSTDYYTAVTTTDQVVSLNYGIASKATAAKTVKVDFAVTYTAVDGKKAIEFVDSAAKATAYNESTNTDGAKKGEYKMYLAVASASALPTANTYKKTTDSAVDSNKTYYTKGNDGTYTKTTPADANALATCYEEDTVIGTEISAKELSDVTMTKATAGNQVFAKGTTNKADASIAYSLGAATYALKDGEKIDFGTTQTDLGNKLEMSTLGGVAGFTLTGAVNPDADWTEADAAAITIAPTYTIANATGSEAAVDSGAYNQVNLGPALAQNAYTKAADNSPIVVTVNNLGDDTIKSVEEGGRTLDSSFVTISSNTATLTSNLLRYITSGTSTFKIVTEAGKEFTFTVTP